MPTLGAAAHQRAGDSLDQPPACAPRVSAVIFCIRRADKVYQVLRPLVGFSSSSPEMSLLFPLQEPLVLFFVINLFDSNMSPLCP